MDNAMTLSDKSHDSEQNLRWLEWERKNRREDRIAEKRMTIVFVLVGVILLILILYALRQVRERPNSVNCGLSAENRSAAILPGMRQISQASLEVDEDKRSPGCYLVFCTNTHSVLASVDTSIPQDTESRQSA